MNNCVKLRGMPLDVVTKDVHKFFTGFSIADSDIHIEVRSGRTTGNAVVVLSGSNEVQKARDRLNRKYIGNRYVDVLIPALKDL